MIPSALKNAPISRLFFLIMAVVPSLLFAQSPVTLENDHLRYIIGADGKNISFVDKNSGVDYLYSDSASFCAQVRKNRVHYRVSKVTPVGKILIMEFGESAVTAAVRTIIHPEFIEFKVLSVCGTGVHSLVFLDIPLRLKGFPGEPFAACALSLNLKTRVSQLPALQSHMWASCYDEFGMSAAAVAVIGVPQEKILPVLKDVISNAEELPKSVQGGPWAKDIPFNHGSYIFNTGNITEENVDDWIVMVKRIGFNQVDHHGGGSFFRWGDFELDRKKWPDGWDSMKRIVAKLHEAGIGSIFHTYSALIDMQSKYASPVPNPGLDAYRSFTLAGPIDAESREITVTESTADVSAVTGFFVHNSVTLHIDDELVTFTGVTKEPPFRFTGCTRGAQGTKAAPHTKDAKARHLKQIVGLFMPDPDTPLFEEIARNNAEKVNYCDFDGIYFDAHGGGLFRGPETSWHYDTKFIYLVWKHLKKPVGMEFGGMEHHWWQFRTRWLALDYPRRGYKRFIDKHIAQVTRGQLLPPFLGWWNFHVWDPPQVEPMFPDVIEYMGCRLIGYDAGMSLHGGIDDAGIKKTPAFGRLAEILREYGEAQLTGAFDERIKARLREPGKEFTLIKNPDGRYNFKPTQYSAHTVTGVSEGANEWTVDNEFVAQPPALRIELLLSAGPYDSPESITLSGFGADEFGNKAYAAGVECAWSAGGEMTPAGGASALLKARNSGAVQRTAAWARFEKKFEPLLDIGKNRALGVWVYGDGKGELLNFRLKGPDYLLAAFADHHVTVDFTGWKYFELIETESERHDEYSWPEDPALYEVYREKVEYDKIETFGIWYNNLPPGEEVTCSIAPVKALRMLPLAVENPSITVNGRSISFPVEMKSGDYLEFDGKSEFVLYAPNGAKRSRAAVTGDAPVFQPGKNSISFWCDAGAVPSVRARVTVISRGEPL